ncbi:MAG: hypothetical protein AABZ06_12720 [Bdellovibrionota bacterium]
MVALFLLALGLQQTPVLAGTYDELNLNQKRAVQSGEQVIILTEDQRSLWPKVIVYQRIGATTEESAAVLADYELQMTYLPGLLQSDIVRRINKSTTYVEYIMDLPWPLSDEIYVMEDRISSYDNGNSYRIDWQMISSDSTKHIEGNARFESLGTGTLLAYSNFIIPTSVMAGSFKNRFVKQMSQTVDAIASQVEKERIQNQNLLDRQLISLREALRQAL